MSHELISYIYFVGGGDEHRHYIRPKPQQHAPVRVQVRLLRGKEALDAPEQVQVRLFLSKEALVLLVLVFVSSLQRMYLVQS